MTDVVDKATRSRMMSGIRASDTKPELVVRSLLHRAGFRFRLRDPQIPGKPDVILPKYRAVVFVHGCFWHAHACDYFKLPSSNQVFWTEKLKRNLARDGKVVRELRKANWRVAVVWECATRVRADQIKQLGVALGSWITSLDAKYLEFRGSKSYGISKRRSTSRAI